jgi:ATP-dependent Lon protease
MSTYDHEYMEEIQKAIHKKITKLPKTKRKAYCLKQIKKIKKYMNEYLENFDNILKTQHK